ncbi:hypothetical protein M8C21_022366 [Ambrosia artemisiifolia]|uniref:Ureidoglycolate hydrolase n=1 Tax=Ambrosia artemisiifolia TaxID=4212 RepID=A0AAD5GC12_AMBAR|nr:hypothetical protein M8C21_022366 [Ambrosia artemisiifolia]
MEATIVKLKAVEATPETFKEFGQVIQASADGEEFGPHDAQLDLSQGTPRLYIMRLRDQALKFSKITHHASVTQCLGGIGTDIAWYLGVAKPSVVDPNLEHKGDNVLKARSGHFFVPPAVDSVQVFKVTGPKFLKLHRGTWHAGPLFRPHAMDFYNLELSNTDMVDVTTYNFKKGNATMFVIED